MGRIKESLLFKLLSDYIQVYLPTYRKSSPYTVTTYKTALIQFIQFAAKEKKIRLSALTLQMLDADMVIKYLNYLESERKLSPSTRNNRLVIIRAFLSYSSACNPEYINQTNALSSIKTKKIDVFAGVEYLSENAIQALLNVPDITSKIGMRDQFLMVLLYDTGARIQELLNIKICDITIGKTPKVKLLGKGNKIRIVPLMDNTVKMLKEYLKQFHPDEPIESNDYLFYTIRMGEHTRISDDAVRCRLNIYASIAKNNCSEVPDKIHPHLFRHSRAMHLYQNGMDLSLISQWLGHSQLTTTLVYAHADTEQKRAAIMNALTSKAKKTNQNDTSFKVTDESLLKRLYNL